MKRNCNRCYALVQSAKTKCGLGFNIEKCKEYKGLTVSYKPLEDCPKPVNSSDYFYYLGLKMRGGKNNLIK